MFERLEQALFRRVDPASLVVFRVIFGGMAVISALRFFWYGWIDQFFHTREVFFHFPGFEWVQVLPWPGMYVLFGALTLAGIGIALGAFYRVSVAVFLVGFTYVGLVDTTNYLNHYWFVRFAAFLMLFMPLGRVGSLDAWRRGESDETSTLPAWSIWVLRAQIGMVYFFAGVAKLDYDWLVRGQPLEIWLNARAHLPLVDSLLAIEWFPQAMAAAGAVFDLSVAFLLLDRRTRPFAYLAVVGFHAATGLLFNIGMFPVIMIGITTIFFEPDWPRRLVPERWLRGIGLGSGHAAGGEDRGAVGGSPVGRRWLVGGLAVWFALQVAMPMRFVWYPGDVNWTQEGFDFAWRVKLVERGGSLSYRVRNPSTGDEWVVHPDRYLTRRQVELASADPAKILELAHHIARDFRERGHGEVEVRADAFVSVNGRPSRRLVDPEVDLAEQPRSVWHQSWILLRDGSRSNR